MEESITITYKEELGNLTAVVTSEVHDGRVLDTKIEIEGQSLCWVSGEQKDEFLNKMKELIEEYSG